MAEVRPGARNRVFLWPKDSEVLFVTPFCGCAGTENCD